MFQFYGVGRNEVEVEGTKHPCGVKSSYLLLHLCGHLWFGHVHPVDDQLPVFMCVGLAGLTAKVRNLH